MTVWFTSDLHFCHKKVGMDFRGYGSTEEHDAAVMGEINSRVRPDDILWILGDLGVGSDTNILSRAAMLNGRKQLITGNHDSTWPAHRNARVNQGKWFGVFESIQAFAKTSVCGTDFLLSHFPYNGDHDGATHDRHTQFRLRNQQMPLLHGHTHTDRKVTSRSKNADLSGWEIHVGWDAWGEPVKDTAIKELWSA